MKLYAIPSHVAQADLIAMLDAKLSRGVTYLRGDDEDYLRVWYQGDNQVHWRATALFGVETLTFKGVDDSAFVEELDLVSTGQALATAEAAQGVALIQAIHTLACLLALDSVVEVDADHLWSMIFHHEHPAVVVCALRASSYVAPTESMTTWVRQLAEAGPYTVLASNTLASWETRGQPRLLPTHDISRLLQRAQAFLAERDWDRALHDTTLAISLDPYQVDAHVVRARAFDGKLDSWGAWTCSMMAHSCAFGDPLTDVQPFMEAHAKKLAGRPVTEAARQIALEFCCSIGEPGIVDEIRAAYEKHDSEGQSKWAYLAMLYGTDVAKIAALEPDSYMVVFHQADDAARAGNTEEAKRLWSRWNNRPEFEDQSFDAFAYWAHEKLCYAAPSLAGQLQALISFASSEKDYQAVLETAELWEELQPGDLASWTWRGIAYTFTQRPTEAIECYSKAIELHEAETDPIYFGEHPISTAYFNRACERSRVSPIEEGAFDDLYRAVKLAARYAEEARADDYMAAIWNDPRFDDAIERGLAESQGGFVDDYDESDV